MEHLSAIRIPPTTNSNDLEASRHLGEVDAVPVVAIILEGELDGGHLSSVVYAGDSLQTEFRGVEISYRCRFLGYCKRLVCYSLTSSVFVLVHRHDIVHLEAEVSLIDPHRGHDLVALVWLIELLAFLYREAPAIEPISGPRPLAPARRGW